MIEKTYKCNLCKDVKKPEDLHGLYWDGHGWVRKSPFNCENHICNRCLFSVKAIADELPKPVGEGKE